MSTYSDVNYQSPIFDRDSEHLKILAICWYVWSGLTFLGGFFPLIYVVIGILMIADPALGSHAGRVDPSTTTVGWIFAAIGSLVSIFAWTISILSLLTGRSLATRRRRMLCFVTSALACLNVPLGVLLGVFTLIVISRQSVKAMFEPQAAAV